MPKKRILPYVLLGLINNKKSLSGYQISQEFKNEVGDFWHASHSQIYPELARMKNDDWLTTASDDGKSTYYSLTETGLNILRQWMAEPLNENEELFSLKLYFIKDESDPLLSSLLDQELSINKKKYDHLQLRLKTVFFDDDQIKNNYGHYLILTRAIERERNHIKWLERKK